ncbi:hypothetical protein MHO82_01990 [Vibrio sp. Of7-15]|uniref:hypothetical protein n=1 Tax=Vibrio sp. Of7-15 TaxID=2724879 RepID=UPI001EF1D267|nr:hypothetical protein [Vibrio sp. Of7-15]MCG7495626.1 hypothetical protein [Vibrio sp. Of7-15]
MPRTFLAFSISALVSASATALDWSASLHASLENMSPQQGYFFPETNNDLKQVSAELGLSYAGLSGVATARKQWLATKQEDDLILNELYIDKSVWAWDFTIGKKRLDWGVGYSYRPLDIIQSYISQPTGITVEEGAWIASAEYFTDTGVLSFLAANSKTQQESNAPTRKGAGVRYYALVGDWDVQALAYYDDVREGLIGGSMVTVIGDALSFHTSATLQRKYNELQHHFSKEHQPFPGNPVYHQVGKNAAQFLSGLTYNFSNNVSLLVEYWFDERSPTNSQWETLIATGNALHSGQDLYGNLTASQNFFTSQNLVRHNLLLHTRYEWERWDPVMDVVLSPEDGGIITTGRIRHTWAGGLWIEAGGRWFGGSNDSVFSQLPDEQVLFSLISYPF